VFLLIARFAAWLQLSRRDEARKTAEILILRHQLVVLQRRQPRRLQLNWADRALLAALLRVMPKARHRGLRLLVTPDTILRWHRTVLRPGHVVTSPSLARLRTAQNSPIWTQPCARRPSQWTAQNRQGGNISQATCEALAWCAF
jgi:putative transposase